MGKTDANDLSITVDVKLPNSEWKNAFSSNTSITLTTSQTSNIFFNFEIPIETQLPSTINFRISLSYYDVNGNRVEKEIKAKWTSNDNYWSYGEESYK